jgi:hypothetical protein
MTTQQKSDDTRLVIGTGWTEVEVVSEEFVLMTARGYAPAVSVQVPKTGLSYYLFISAKTLATPLETLRENNAGQFTGLHFRLRKASKEIVSPYEVEAI